MRTNIVIDDELMADALEATGAKTKREVVELGLRELLYRRAAENFRALRGRTEWVGDLHEMRRDR